MKRFLLAVALIGCSGRVHEEPEQPLAAACAAAMVPTAPRSPADACVEESFGAGDTVVSTTRRTTAVADGIVTTREETFNAAGVLSRHVVRRTRGALVLFESTEHPLLGPDESLPYTYGEAATFSISYRYDSEGHLLDKSYDRGMDGTIETEDVYRYEGAILREHVQLASGKLVRREVFDADGDRLSELDAGEYGRRYTYDANGLLIVEEKLDAGVVTERTEWKMRTKKDPLHRVTFDAKGMTIGEQTWKYDGDRLLSVDGFGIFDGRRRTNHTEFDAVRREVRLIEVNEEPSCRTYDRTTVYGADDEPLQQTTTCDGRPFETLATTLDSSGRKLRVDHAFYGNPLSVTNDSREYVYDDCGRLSRFVSTYNGVIVQKQIFAYDAAGRLVTTTSEDRTGTESSATIAYDESGRVVAMDGRRWTYDERGRIVRVDGEVSAAGRDEPRVVAVRFTHC